MSEQWRLWLVLFVTIFFCLAVSEWTLRSLGYEARPAMADDLQEPTMNEEDPILGWKSKAGRYRYPAYDGSEEEVTVTILRDGDRATRRTGNPAGPDIVLLGGSFTLGAAISDRETFGWKLQSRFPSLNLRNFGVAGYGTFQSLLLFEQTLGQTEVPPRLAIYGLIGHHEARNVGGYEWGNFLSRFSRRGHVDLPYARIDEQGRLVRYPPVSYADGPLVRAFATVYAVRRLYHTLRDSELAQQKRSVTLRLILELRETCACSGCELLVVALDIGSAQQRDYPSFAAESGIRYVDCTYWGNESGMSVPDEGHPSGALHTIWADCIGDMVEEILGSEIEP